MVDDDKAAPGGTMPMRRARIALLVALVALTPMLSGCTVIEFFTPQPEQVVPEGDGRIRIWAAVQPGALGEEFGHLNVTFGPLAVPADAFHENMIPAKSYFTSVDLIALERSKKAALLGELIVPPGEYHGVSYHVVDVQLGMKQIVGNDNGEPVYAIQPRNISFSGHAIPLRVQYAIVGGTTDDVFIEIDLQKSLLEEDGHLKFTLVPTGTSVYTNGVKFAESRTDGGASELGIDGDPPNGYGSRWEDNSRFKPPFAVLDVYDPDSDDRIYSSAVMPAKRLNRAVGLGEDLRFDATRSRSQVAEMADEGVRTLPIVDYRWDFADGTTARGLRPTVVKNYTSGGLHDVVLSTTDEKGLTGTNHMTLFVPYRPDEAIETEADARTGTLFVGSATAPTDTEVDSASHTFTFPGDLEDGGLRLGGYRVTVRYGEPTGGLLAGATSMRARVDSGHFQAEVEGFSPLEIASAGVPVWRGPLSKWVDTSITVELELITGVLVDYDVAVEGLYYGNMSRGLDAHATHAHGEWLFGPKFDELTYEGKVREETEE